MRWIILVFTSLLLFFSCKKIERINPVDGIVGVQTSAVQQLDLSSVQIGTTLQVTEEVPNVTQRGVCWSTNPNPTTANDFVAQGSGFGTFQSKITGLSGNTKYYFRSFASNEKTTVYGNEVSYTIKAPVLRTKTAIDISYTSAKVGGELVNDGGLIVSEYGIYWGVFPGISSENSKLIATQKDFYLDLTELENGKTYYYRTFVQTNLGIVYGEEMSFNTLGYNTPSLTTKLVTNIGTNTAMSGGEITSDGGVSITEKGVCWSTTTNPTIADNKSMEGAGTDSYTSKLDGLEDGVTYYVRAYATNSKGTSYGNEVSFTTFAFYKPTLKTNSITNISANGAVSGGVISSDGGAPITAKGICWSTTSNPTITGNKTNDGTGSVSFTSQLSGLQEGAKYYVRAYATNSKGTSYGNEVSFTSNEILIDIEGNKYKTVKIGAQVWMAENLRTSKYNDGTVIPNITDNTNWSNLTTGAWSYYNNDAVNNAKYGKLYNWYAVIPTTNGNKNLCPNGWHVPTDAEWTVLTDYLGGQSVAGGKMKDTTSWVFPNTDATNTSLFTGLPGGYRVNYGLYGLIGNDGFWWSSTQVSTNIAWFLYLYSGDGNAYMGYYNNTFGLSVRCLRD
jgi:uncharacterized protein (TIGR02145 family)